MSAPSYPSSQDHRTAPSAAGPTATLRFRRGDEVRRAIVAAGTICIGSDPLQDIVLPGEWAKPRHLVIEYDAGIARVRAAEPDAHAFLASTPITTEGTILLPGATISIPCVNRATITIECEFDGYKGVMLLDDTSTFPADVAAPEVVGVSPLEESKSLFATGPEKLPSKLRHKKVWPRTVIGLVGMGIALGIILASLYWNDLRRALWRSTVERQYTQVVRDIAQAQSLIAQGHYVEAKSVVDDATQIASNGPAFTDQILVLRSLSASPEIRWGGLGYVRMENRWLPPETAAAWRWARLRDDPRIMSIFDQAKADLAAKTDLESAEQSCAGALALMAAEPVHPHPMQQPMTALRDQIHASVITLAMTAKGYVLYNNRWVTPAQQFLLEQDAKGLALYKGKWISKSAAFTAMQADRGLVLYRGKWVTPDDVKIAQGLVKFEGAWVTPSRKAENIRQRQATAKMQEQRIEQARTAAAQKAEEKRKAQDAIEARYPEAYQMSQEFVKDILKSPASAQFQPITSPKVHITYADGWYMVTAVVDAQNTFGVALRSTYLCKLRPSGVDHWEAGNTYLKDN